MQSLSPLRVGTVVLIMVLVGMAGCGKAKTEASGDPKNASSGNKPGLSPDQYAQGLMAHQNELAVQGFSVKVPMDCYKTTDQAANWAIKCRTILNDAKRGGAPGVVDVQLYDHDVTFTDEIAPVKQKIVDMQGRDDSLINYKPDLYSQDKQGKETAIQATCHQVQGTKNSPVYCGMLVNSRVFVVSGTVPAEASTRNIVISGEGADDSQSASRDLHHASDLALFGLAMVGSVK